MLSSNQSRHLIRSIFKTNPTPIVSDAGNSNGNIVNGGSGTIDAENLPDAPYASGTINDSEFLILSSPTKEEPEDELMQPKKVKNRKEVCLHDSRHQLNRSNRIWKWPCLLL